MLEFNTLTIPEGEVVKIEDSNGVVLWKKAKPKFYDYLQNDGTAYINTNVYGYMNHKYKLIYQFVNGSNGNSLIFGTRLGAYAGQNMSMSYVLTNNSVLSTLYWNSQTGGGYRVDLDAININKHALIIDDGVVNYDGVDKGTSAGYNSNFSIQNSIYLFAINSNTNGTPYCGLAKIYEFKDYDSLGNLIRDMVPCEYKGEYGMWDKVENKFYRNANSSGVFSVGSEIEYYDYLQTASGAYIDTEFKPNQDSRVVADILLFNRNLTAIFGTRNNSAWPHSAFVLWNSNIYYQYGNVVYDTYKLSNAIVNKRITIDLNKNIGTINNSDPVTCNTATFQTNYPLLIGNIHTGSGIDPRPTNMKVYAFKIYDNGTLVRDYKPCLYNSQAGLWDSVECKFYGNANSSGTLTVGNDA